MRVFNVCYLYKEEVGSSIDAQFQAYRKYESGPGSDITAGYTEHTTGHRLKNNANNPALLFRVKKLYEKAWKKIIVKQLHS